MAKIGYGYGSECHLLRWMGRHRTLLESKILDLEGVPKGKIEFLDFHFKRGELWPDGERKGLDFLSPDHPAQIEWLNYWPQTGNVPNWDAVGKLIKDGGEEWLLLEAKSHIEELKSECNAKERGGLQKIRNAFTATVDHLGIHVDESLWLEPYYQYANRLAVLSFLHTHKVPARLINIYFMGDFIRPGWTSPQTEKDWETPLKDLKSRLGLDHDHSLRPFVHELFLNIAFEK